MINSNSREAYGACGEMTDRSKVVKAVAGNVMIETGKRDGRSTVTMIS